MDTNAVALRALASIVAGAVLAVIGLVLLLTLGASPSPLTTSPNAGDILAWGIVVLGAMLVQAGLVGFVISGWAGVRATLDAER